MLCRMKKKRQGVVDVAPFSSIFFIVSRLLTFKFSATSDRKGFGCVVEFCAMFSVACDLPVPLRLVVPRATRESSSEPVPLIFF